MECEPSIATKSSSKWYLPLKASDLIIVYHKLIKVAISWRKFLLTEQLYIGLHLYPLLQLLSGMQTKYS